MTRPKPKKPPRVAGEPVDALVEALLAIDTRARPDGMVELEGRFRPAIGAPFARALMRVEAELLLADARVYGTDAEEVRSPDARRADALLLLARRVSATRGVGIGSAARAMKRPAKHLPRASCSPLYYNCP